MLYSSKEVLLVVGVLNLLHLDDLLFVEDLDGIEAQIVFTSH